MELTRRSFLKGAGIVGAGAMAVGIVGCGPSEQTTDPSAQESTQPGPKTYSPDESISADVAIVGAGNSGMCAAIEATEAGLDVVLIEKSSELGGSSFATEVIFGLGSAMQHEAGLDLPYRYQVVDQELAYTNHHSDPLLWGDYIERSGENIDWLRDQGVVFDCTLVGRQDRHELYGFHAGAHRGAWHRNAPLNGRNRPQG